MGYTAFTIDKISRILEGFAGHSVDNISGPSVDISRDGTIRVMELGAQNRYNQPVLPAPYMKEWYEERGIDYTAIDLSGENESWKIDLSWPIRNNVGVFDLVVDAGTSEHCGRDGHYDINAYYNCWKNKHELCQIGGIIFSENPATKSWPGHGFFYLNKRFYYELCGHADYELLDCNFVAAMGNITDGWNVYATIHKNGDKFPTLEQFKTFSVFTA
jgi:hypothetical protein